MDLVCLVRAENICEGLRCQERAQVHVLPLEAPVLETLFLEFRFYVSALESHLSEGSVYWTFCLLLEME